MWLLAWNTSVITKLYHWWECIHCLGCFSKTHARQFWKIFPHVLIWYIGRKWSGEKIMAVLIATFIYLFRLLHFVLVKSVLNFLIIYRVVSLAKSLFQCVSKSGTFGFMREIIYKAKTGLSVHLVKWINIAAMLMAMQNYTDTSLLAGNMWKILDVNRS